MLQEYPNLDCIVFPVPEGWVYSGRWEGCQGWGCWHPVRKTHRQLVPFRSLSKKGQWTGMSLFLILLATVGHTQAGKCPGAAGEGLLSPRRKTDFGLCGVLESLSGVQTGQVTTGGTGVRVTPLPLY